LNRNTTITYSDGTSRVDRYFDGATNGKNLFWYEKTSNPSTLALIDYREFTAYDVVGRPTVMRQVFASDSVNYDYNNIQRAYNLAGLVTSLTYPSGHTVTYNYDAGGRLADLDGTHVAFAGNLGAGGSPRTYAQGVTYAPAGQLKQEQFGTTTPVYDKLFYNSRQQLAEILASTTGGDSSWNRGKIVNGFSLQCSGAGCNATDNNGSLRKQEVDIPGNDQVSTWTSWYQQYDYDAVNRLQRVHEYTGNSSLDWQQEYVYDRWGNRTIHQTNTFGPNIPKPNFGVNTANNRLTAPTGNTLNYDAVGNVTTDTLAGAGDRTFDAESRMTGAGGGSSLYTYNAGGQRVRRKINGQETWQIYGFDGELLAEYPAKGAASGPSKEYGYRNGQLLISAEAGVSLAPPTFADDFNDNSLNANSWTVDVPNSTPTVSEQSQQLQIALAPNTAAYNGVHTNATYNLTNKMAQVESVQAVSQAGWCENFFEAELDASN
jgi:hypothetical protein